MLNNYGIEDLPVTRYVFFTGKGGVGKTSLSCATAVALAERGKRVILISTDPASNLQDIFGRELGSKGTPISEVTGLTVANFNPEVAAAEYRERAVGPYRGVLPDEVVANMEEQLSGACTLEIAAFNEFAASLADEGLRREYDHILFDTAPTGHTLRMLQLPSAWHEFIETNTHGASCLGQLSGLEKERAIYAEAVETLKDPELTTLVLVSRAERAPLNEAARASLELGKLGILNQRLLINGLLSGNSDETLRSIVAQQTGALADMPDELKGISISSIPLKTYNISGVEQLKSFFKDDGRVEDGTGSDAVTKISSRIYQEMGYDIGLESIVDDLSKSSKRVIFTMGKGGVGKTTVAVALAEALHGRGHKVHLATTDPAAHLKGLIVEKPCLTVSAIDEQAALERYRQDVLSTVAHLSPEDIAYLEEDMRSPCTQEIAVFRAFAEIVARSEDEMVIIDTAPTGHTLLLLDATLSHHREVARTQGQIPESVRNLLPRLRDPEWTEVLIVTLAENTPYHEADRLEADLKRAGIHSKWWIVNNLLGMSGSDDLAIQTKGAAEKEWVQRIHAHTGGHMALIGWNASWMAFDKKVLER